MPASRRRRSPAGSCIACCRSAARVILENLRRVFGATRARGRDRAARAGALRASVAARSASSSASAGCRAERKRRWCASRTSRRSSPRSSARQGRADPHRPFRQLGSGDRRRHRATFPQMHGRFHFVRRADQAALARRARHAPLPTRRLRRRWPSAARSIAILERLAAGDVIVFPFDQHAQPPDGIDGRVLRPSGVDVQEPRDHRARHRRAGAAGDELARARRHARAALRGAAAARSNATNVNEAIRRNTRAYNAALERLILRHPEQWYWVHRRWKIAPKSRVGRSARSAVSAGMRQAL